MKLKQTTLAAALTAALAMGVSGQASAEVYAGASLDITNLKVVFVPTSGSPVPGSFGFTDYTFTANANAVLNGSSANTPGSCGTIAGPACPTTSPTLDSIANAPGGTATRVDGASEFTFFGPGSGDTYANAASEITQSELATKPAPGSTTVHQISEVEIGGTGVGQADTLVESVTNLRFTFTVSGTGTVDFTLTFDADPDLYVYSVSPNQLSRAATANIQGGVSLNGSDGTTMSWTPNGTTGGANAFDTCSGGIIACTETVDSEDLVTSIGLPPTPATKVAFSDARGGGSDPGAQAFGIKVTSLGAGTYNLDLWAKTYAKAEQRVPEPATLALLGLGLAGLGVTARRRKV